MFRVAPQAVRSKGPAIACARAPRQARKPEPNAAASRYRPGLRDIAMLKAIAWFVVIVFIIGLLVVFGVLDLIF